MSKEQHNRRYSLPVVHTLCKTCKHSILYVMHFEVSNTHQRLKRSCFYVGILIKVSPVSRQIRTRTTLK